MATAATQSAVENHVDAASKCKEMQINNLFAPSNNLDSVLFEDEIDHVFKKVVYLLHSIALLASNLLEYDINTNNIFSPSRNYFSI